jgi:type IV secretory pathway TraG/TraD family ATPase VirD4
MEGVSRIEVFAGDGLQDGLASLARQPAWFLEGFDRRGQPAKVGLDAAALSKHLLFLGGIGMGKTTALFQLVSQLQRGLQEQDVMIVFDSKGDFHQEFCRKGDVVLSNDQKATGGKGRDYWNIFLEFDQGDQETSVLEVAKSLFYEKIKESKDGFFPGAAKDLFAAVLLHACRGGFRANNEALREFFNCAGIEALRGVLELHGDLGALVNYVASDDSRMAQGIVAELQQLVREIFIGNFRQRGQLGIRQLVRAKGGRTIFIEYDVGMGNVLTPIYRLLFDLALKEALSRSRSDGQVYFVADEFRLLPHLQHIGNAVNFGRSLGVKMLVGVQNVEQLFEIYGEHQARSLLSGFSSCFAFRLNDAVSRRFVQDLYGQNKKKLTFLSSVQNRGIVEQLSDAHVVEDWDLTRLGVGEAIVGLAGQLPAYFKFKPPRI